MDGIFGKDVFVNEIVWKRTSAHKLTKGWGLVHDTILFYSGGSNYQWNRTFRPYEDEQVENFYRYHDGKERYRIGDLTAPGSRNGEYCMPWRGIDPGI